MEQLEKNSSASIETAPEQLYECPCGKAYRSYPALFTHLKNKHNGQAPGIIKKPILPLKKRGRPCLKSSISTQETPQNQPKPQEYTYQRQQIRTSFENNEPGSKCLASLVKLLSTLPLSVVSKSSLNEMAAVVEMNVYLITQQSSQGSLLMGTVVAEFLREVSQRVEWPHFSQVYALLMLLVQFIIEQRKDSLILTQGSVDLLCDYINNFLIHGLPRMARVYSLSNLAILTEQAVLTVFHSFFGWLMAKRYTNYRICLAVDLQ